MDSWTNLLFKALSSSSDNNSPSEQDVKNIVRQEILKNQNNDKAEFLIGVLQMLEEKKKAEKQEQEEKNIKAQLAELNRKLERLDRNKNVQETREWMQNLVDKMAGAGSGRPRKDQPTRQPQVFRGKSISDLKNADDSLPWMDRPKRGQKGDESSTHTATRDNFRGRGRGNFHGRGRGTFQHQAGQNRENDQKDHQSTTGTGNPHRGTYRGHGRGAIPKNARGGKFAPGEMKDLSTKLQNLSVSDVQVSLSPEDIVTIKNALKTMNSTENQTKNKKKKKKNAKKNLDDQKEGNEGGPAKPTKEDDDEDEEEEDSNVTAKKKGSTPSSKETDSNPSSNKKDSTTPKEKGSNPSSKKKNSTPPSEETDSNPSPQKKATPSSKKKDSAPSSDQTEAAEESSLQLYPVNGFNDSVLRLLPEDQELNHAVLMVRLGSIIHTFQPRTIKDLIEMKSQYPSGQLYSTKPSPL